MTGRIAIYACAAVALFSIHADAAIKYAKVGGATSGDCNTWANACTMNYALSVATTGDSIWAKKTAGGSPYGPIELKNGVKIIGGFAGTESQPSQSNPTTKVTVIDGGGTQPCLYSDGNGSSTVLRGFTISNCANTDSGDWDGGGALVLDNSDAVFVNCIFEDNTSVRFGAAVSIRGTGSPKFFNCIFRNNGSGTSGGAQDDDVTPMAGGAVYVHSGTPSFTNCLFHGNKAAEGAVLANVSGAPTLTNCTIANNYAKYGYGGAINDAQKKTVLRNCILWGNTAIKGGDQIFDVPTGELAVTYSNVQGAWTGDGNLNSDPLFASPGNGNYSLQSTSPCVNAGSGVLPDDAGDLDWDGNTSEPTPTDLAGNVRVVNTIEIGAYERQMAGSED